MYPKWNYSYNNKYFKLAPIYLRSPITSDFPADSNRWINEEEEEKEKKKKNTNERRKKKKKKRNKGKRKR